MVMRAVDVLNENCELDFIDLNCGCPIDLVYNAGSGMKRCKLHVRRC